MLTRKLGRSRIEVSALGMGCWAIGGPFSRSGGAAMGWGDVDDDESIRAIHAAIEMGITLFDTANNYGAGHSEEVLGRALKGRRDQVTIATKFGSVFDEEQRMHLDISPEIDEAFIRDALEGSLRRLQTDHIDFYQLHVGNYDADKAETLPPILEKLVQEGKIRWYGWSTDLPDRAAIFAKGEHCTGIQHRLNVFWDAAEMLDLCAQHNLASINKQPLSSGILTGKFRTDTTFPENDGRHGINFNDERGQLRLKQVEGMREILTSGGRTITQGALAWIWGRSPLTIPIPGFKTVKQVQENAGAMQFGALSPDQMRQIDQILEREPVLKLV